MHGNKKKEAEMLRNAISRIEGKCLKESRQPFPVERNLLREMRNQATRVENSIPNAPLSQPGADMTNGFTSHGSSGAFSSFNDFVGALVSAGNPAGQTDQRLFAAATGLGETVSSDGGFLVQSDFSQDIYSTAFETGKLGKLCRRIQISGNSNGIKIPGLDETSRVAGSRQGGVLSYWLDEAGEKQASKPKFRVVELDLKKTVVLVYSTDELLADSRALAPFIQKAASDEIAFTLDDAIINGTGAGQPLGVLNSGGLVSVAAETGQASQTIVPENLFKMWSRMLGSSRQNSCWLINQNIEPMLYQMSLSVGTGGSPVFMPGGGMSEQPFMTLFGRPIIPCEHCATLGTVGDIILADFTNGYVLAEKGGIQSDMSIHVQFIYDQSVFRFVFRVDGSPMLAAPVTPFKGGSSYTQSHFVALATRS